MEGPKKPWAAAASVAAAATAVLIRLKCVLYFRVIYFGVSGRSQKTMEAVHVAPENNKNLKMVIEDR